MTLSPFVTDLVTRWDADKFIKGGAMITIESLRVEAEEIIDSTQFTDNTYREAAHEKRELKNQIDTLIQKAYNAGWAAGASV